MMTRWLFSAPLLLLAGCSGGSDDTDNKAVSYTHLDVYKRQSLSLAIAPVLVCGCDTSETGDSTLMRQIDHHIVGGAGGNAGRLGDVLDPNNGGVQAQVALGDKALLDRAVAAAKAAQPAWAAVNPQRRARVMFEYKRLVEANMDELAQMLSAEHGKVIADAKGDIQRGLEVVEFCCGIPHVLKGEYTQGAGPGIDVYSMRQPLGIGVGITPFNFPAMIPLWMGAVATAVGNAFILKPSERDPSVPVRLAELFLEAGMPEGIFQVVHGDKEMVDAILDHPDIAAVSFCLLYTSRCV